MTMIETQPRLAGLTDDVAPAPPSAPSAPQAASAKDQQPRLAHLLVDDGTLQSPPRSEAKTPASPQADPPVPGGKPTSAEAQKGSEPPAANDPRVAAYVLDLPQNYTPDAEQLGRFKGLAVKHGLAPEAATELVAFHAQVLKAEEQALAQEAEAWLAASEKLPEMQGDGRQAVAHAAALADRQTKAWLDSTGLGNHPEFVRWAARVGRELYRLQGGRPEPMPSQRQQPRLPHLNP